MAFILDKPDLHPSKFQTNNTKDLKNIRTLKNVNDERSMIFPTLNLDKLISPGSYDFTPDDNQLDGSNTKSMFKNLYGETLLTFLFFSQDNVFNLQKLIRMLVFKEMNKVIDNQSNNDLLIIMRSIFLAYSEHPLLIDEGMSPQVKKKLIISYTVEVDRLNQLVIDVTIPLIVSQLQQYLTYLYDASTPLHVMEKPISTSVSGTRNYRSQTQVLLGGNL